MAEITISMHNEQPHNQYTHGLVLHRMRWQHTQATNHLQRGGHDGAAKACVCARTGLLLLLNHLAGHTAATIHPRVQSRLLVRRRWSLQGSSTPSSQGPSLQHAARAVRRARSTSFFWGPRSASPVDAGEEGWRLCIEQGVQLMEVLRRADCSVQARRDVASVCRALLRACAGVPDELHSMLTGML